MIRTNTCRPPVAYRVMAWGCFLVGALILALFIGAWIRGTMQPAEAWICLIGFSLMAWGSAWLVNEAMACYAWDDDQLLRRDLFWKRSVLWNEINRYKVRRAFGDFTYILHDCHGVKLVVNFQLLQGEASPLYSVVQEKLAPIIKATCGAKDTAEPQTIDIQMFGIKTQSLELEKDHLVYCKRAKRQCIPYDQIKYVFVSIHYQYGFRAGETHVFSDGISNLFSINSQCRDFDRIIFQLKSRLPNAKWIEPGASLEMEDVLVLLKRDHVMVNKEIRQRIWIGLCFIPGFAYIFKCNASPDAPGISRPVLFLFAIFVFFTLRDQIRLNKFKKAVIQKIHELEEQQATR